MAGGQTVWSVVLILVLRIAAAIGHAGRIPPK
jgi:hypothetical protein